MLESLLEYCREAARVCPVPHRWNELWELLPSRERSGAGWEPSPPLILGAWWNTSNLDKMVRFESHVRWADDHGGLADVDEFLRRLPETEWHHLGD